MLPIDVESARNGLEHYFSESLAIPLSLAPWHEADGLPHYLRQDYTFFVGIILGNPCLFMMHIGGHGGPPDGLLKQLSRAGDRWNGLVIYVSDVLSARQRRRLVAQHIPFVVPNNQLFLPPLGIDLREHFVRRQVPPTHLEPSAQVLVLDAALRQIDMLSLSQAAENYDYSKMTMSRAFDSLERLALGVTQKHGRQRVLQFVKTGQALWEASEPYLSTPVHRAITVANVPGSIPALVAGESALAQFTSLAPPSRRVLAIGAKEWSAFREENSLAEVDVPYSGDVDVEVWSYPPQKISTIEVVDFLSLLLSVQSSADPRVQLVMEELKELLPW
jgi:DNA-binding MarR family transcriptional regulator